MIAKWPCLKHSWTQPEKIKNLSPREEWALKAGHEYCCGNKKLLTDQIIFKSGEIALCKHCGSEQYRLIHNVTEREPWFCKSEWIVKLNIIEEDGKPIKCSTCLKDWNSFLGFDWRFGENQSEVTISSPS